MFQKPPSVWYIHRIGPRRTLLTIAGNIMTLRSITVTFIGAKNATSVKYHGIQAPTQYGSDLPLVPTYTTPFLWNGRWDSNRRDVTYISLSLKLASMSSKHAHSWVVIFQLRIRGKGDPRICPLDIFSCYIYWISHLPSQFSLTLTFPSSPLLPALCHLPPPSPPTPYMSPSLYPYLHALGLFRPATTISPTPAPPAVAPLPDIYPVLSKWRYTGRRYSGGGVFTSPPLPVPLPLFPHQAADISTFPPCTSSAAYFPSWEPRCGGILPGSSQSEGTSPMIQCRTRVLLEPPLSKISWPSGDIIPPALKSATSVPTTSAPSSNISLLSASCHPNLS